MLMNFFRKLMYGRYGSDQLSFFLLIVYVILILLSGLLFGGIKSGAAQVNRVASLPMDYVMIIQAMVVVLVAAPRLIDAILKPLRKLAKAKGDKG